MAIEGVRLRPDGIVLTVRLTPKGGRDALDGWTRDGNGKRQLKVRVTAPPEDGKANAALEGLLAGALGVAKRAVRIAKGEKSRTKMVEIDGDAGALMARLEVFGEAP